MNPQNACLCGSGLAYLHCCAPLHSGEKIPLTAEALMRSRFVAFCLKNEAYLLTTWSASLRPSAIDFSKDNTEWLRLEMVSVKKGGVKDNKGMVTFSAYYRQDGEERVMNETSRFNKIDGRWFYLDGVVKFFTKAQMPTAQNQNALCACGSGKKFKRCCGA